jgi:hypothetical protein
VNPAPFDPRIVAPDGVAIRVEVEDGTFEPEGEVVERRENTVGDLPALRVVVRRDDGQHAFYIVGLDGQLPPTAAANRLLVAYTTGGDETFSRDSATLNDLFRRFTAADPVAESAEAGDAADALMEQTSTCTNSSMPFEIHYPHSWFTNARSSGVPACTWFGPDPIVVPEGGGQPTGAISIQALEGAFGTFEPIFSFDSRNVAGYPAQRTERYGGTVTAPDRSVRSVQFFIQLGREITGTNLIATTGTGMTSDYELAKAVLDRMMAGATAR